MNAYSFLTRAAELWPSKVAVAARGESVTFGELLKRSEELKHALFETGIRPGMGLGLVAANGPEFLVGLFAGLASGAVVMPISENLRPQEVNRMLELVPLAGVLHEGSFSHDLPRSTETQRGRFSIAMRPRECHLKVAPGVPNAAVIRFTSGTTGSAKGVVLSHQTVFERTEASVEGLQLSQGDAVLWVLPMAYHFVVSILTYVRYGIAVVVPDGDSPEQLISSAQQHSPQMLYGAPAVVQSLINAPSGLSLPRSMRVVSTSSCLYPQHARTFEQRFGTSVEQLYGLFEVGLPLGSGLVSGGDGASVGRALPRYEVAILDPAGQSLPAGHMGSLAVRGPGMFDAYLAPYRPAADALLHGWFLTGDLAVQSYDGSITVKGREKSVINVAGNKVFPEEVEGVINSYPGIQASRVYGLEHTQSGEMVVAEAVPQQGASIDVTALATYLSEKLSRYKLPSALRLVDSIERTDSGKIRRVAQG